MKDISLIDLAADYTDMCEWCAHPCRDEDKYDMLVICINIQKECLAISAIVNLILGGRAPQFMQNLMEIIRWTAEHIDVQSGTRKTENPVSITGTGKKWGNTGCSRIFQLAQFIEQSYLNRLHSSD